MPRSKELRLDSKRPKAIRGFRHGGRIKCESTLPASEGISVMLLPGGSQFILHASDNVVVTAGANASMVLRDPADGHIARLKLKYFDADRRQAPGKNRKKKK